MSLANSLSKYVFAGSLAVVGLGGAFAYGVMAQRYSLQPVPLVGRVAAMVGEVVAPSDQILRSDREVEGQPIEMLLPDAVQPGLLLVAEAVNGRDTTVKIMDRSGDIVQEWYLSWSEVWPDGTGDFPPGRRPEQGMYLHGVDLLPDGDLVANFEHLSSFRADVCGDILWKRDNLGHHAVHTSYDGTVWVAAATYLEEGPTGLPMHEAPLHSWTLEQLDPDGTVLREIAVFDILVQNDLMGLLYLSTLEGRAPYSVSGDTLHLNDVDVFPEGMESEVFAPGDLMISLRNINAVLVVDPETLDVKFMTIGGVVRHHDPDFLEGDRISIFDNANFTMSDAFEAPASRIVEVDATTGEQEVVLDGAGEVPFFTNIMGTHQRLQNGNILVNESEAGRVMEFTLAGDLVYRYDNRISEDENGRTFNAIVLPQNMDKAFFAEQQEACTE